VFFFRHNQPSKTRKDQHLIGKVVISTLAVEKQVIFFWLSIAHGKKSFYSRVVLMTSSETTIKASGAIVDKSCGTNINIKNNIDAVAT
jgi:hypothetical protein